MFIHKILISVFVLSLAAPAYSQELYVGKDGNIKNVETRAMHIEDGVGYLATPGALYRIGDIAQDEKWQEVFSLPAGDNEITCFAAKGKNVFLGTRRGLFRSMDGERTWRNVFRTVIPEKNNILSIDISIYYPGKVIISTVKGVFLSEDLGAKWADISANIGNKRIRCAVLNKDSIYAAGDDGLYIRKAGESGWERMYVNSAPEDADSDAAEGYSEGLEYAGAASAVNCVMVRGSRIYAGVNKVVVYSDDEGKKWSPLPSSGLAGSINYILASKKTEKLYCATSRGVFEFTVDKAGWSELYKGTDRALNATGLIFFDDSEAALWALTEKGLYRIEALRYQGDEYIDVERNLRSLKITFGNEPNFRELQGAAMHFGDVHPDKIKAWHRDSRLKALVPKLSLNCNIHRSNNSEIYTSATTNYVTMGPDDTYKSADLSFSWDISQLIWSDDQTNIDVRSRLTTQLRNDILDDLRRAYYERRRLQFDIMTSPPKDLKSRFERELRIQELTQAIDDLTGNYLSDHTSDGNGADEKGKEGLRRVW